VASVLGILAQWTVFVIQPTGTLGSLKLLTSPLATAVEVGLGSALWAGLATITYHTIHQLRLVREIYNRHTRISLFALGPLYAFSWLTARTALLLVGVTVVLGAVLPDVAQHPEELLLGGFGLAVAGVTFVAPLWGVHQLLAEEKAAHQDRLARRLEESMATLEKAAPGDVTSIGELKTGLEALVVARKELDGISTWPWQPETLRTVVTALVLPLLLWLVTRLVERMGL
jgi:hypothetical protein